MAILLRLHEYWLSKHIDGKLPRRTDIDPLDFTYALGEVSLIDVTSRNPWQFTCRLMGSNIQSRLSIPMKGKNINEFPEEHLRKEFMQAYQIVAETAQPITYTKDNWDNKKSKPMTMCYWPFSNGGKEVDMILCCREFFVDRSSRWWAVSDTLNQFRE